MGWGQEVHDKRHNGELAKSLDQGVSSLHLILVITEHYVLLLPCLLCVVPHTLNLLCAHLIYGHTPQKIPFFHYLPNPSAGPLRSATPKPAIHQA